jgi:hypothetical protein
MQMGFRGMKAKDLISSLFNKKRPEVVGLDGFPIYQDSPFKQAQLEISEYLVRVENKVIGLQEDAIKDMAAHCGILYKPLEERQKMIHALMERIAFQYGPGGKLPILTVGKENTNQIWQFDSALKSLFAQLLSSKLKIRLPVDDLIWMLKIIGEKPIITDFYFPTRSLMRQVKKETEENGVSPDIKIALEKIRQIKKGRYGDDLIWRNGIDRILNEPGKPDLKIEPGELWSDKLKSDLTGMDEPSREKWLELLYHASQSLDAKPSRKWLSEAQEKISEVGQPEFISKLLFWLDALNGKQPARMMLPQSSSLLKGLIWACCFIERDDLARAIGNAAIVCFQKIPSIGARSVKAGNACIYTLSAMPGQSAASELIRIQQKVKYVEAQRLVSNVLDRLAEKRGLTVADVEELSVPDFSLGAGGRLVKIIGEYRIELTIDDLDTVSILWVSPDAKITKSVPATVKEQHKGELASLQKTAKAIRSTLSAQRFRIEKSYLNQRALPFSQWKVRYIDHPLIRLISCKLIWFFDAGDHQQAGIWKDGQIVDVNNHPLSWVGPDTQVRLWHPLGCDVETVLAWRNYLEQNQITQPFKQAYREIYILTDAEINTLTYSNRFAAHILKQHQFAALCKERGWVYHLQGDFDSYNRPTLSIPQANLRVEFWVEAVTEANTYARGIYQFVTTDQVRFYDLEGSEPLNLTEIPALNFSEIMRDVDLFVGVCSIGNDPAWLDHGENTLNQYWHLYSFGDLSQSAKSRKEVLERLLPRLKIGDRCQISDKFLVVKGHIRNYKIHLGSGNILMSPNDQYLCIVPGPAAQWEKSKIWLPFEGDQTLALILSKALLLANDDQIQDATILRQIKFR